MLCMDMNFKFDQDRKELTLWKHLKRSLYVERPRKVELQFLEIRAPSCFQGFPVLGNRVLFSMSSKRTSQVKEISKSNGFYIKD